MTRVDELCDRFEAAWRSNVRPRLEDFLEQVDALGWDLAFRELLALEVQLLLHSGAQPRQEDYVSRFPREATLISEVWEEISGSGQPIPADSEAGRPRPEGNSLAGLSPDGVPLFDESPTAGALEEASRFWPIRFLAQGGLGEVYVAQDQQLPREVALKQIRRDRLGDPELQIRFLQEAEVTSSLEHPGIVPVYGLGRTSDGRACYAMRLIHGRTLQEMIHHYHRSRPNLAPSERRLRLRELLVQVVAVAQALQYAHSRGVIHRDVKPGNILVGRFGETYLVDWGLAKRLIVPAEGSRILSAGASTIAKFGKNPLAGPESSRPPEKISQQPQGQSSPSAIESVILLDSAETPSRSSEDISSQGLASPAGPLPAAAGPLPAVERFPAAAGPAAADPRDAGPHTPADHPSTGAFASASREALDPLALPGQEVHEVSGSGMEVEVLSSDGPAAWRPTPKGRFGSETATGMVLGTPGYMSPEQAQGDGNLVGPASDVYSLGSTLYCVLTGRAPFQQGALSKVVPLILEGSFPHPREVDPTIPPALEAICLQAMELNPSDRYASAGALALDLERWLADEPVKAYRESAWERGRRWARRNQSWVLAGLAALVLISVFGGLATWFTAAAWQEERNALGREHVALIQVQKEKQHVENEKAQAIILRGKAEESRREAVLALRESEASLRLAEAELYVAHVNLAHGEWDTPNVPRMLGLLKKTPVAPRNWEWRYLVGLTAQERFRVEIPRELYQPLQISPDGRWLAVAADERILLLDPATGALRHTLVAHTHRVAALSWHRTQPLLATCARDRQIFLWNLQAPAEENLAAELSPSTSLLDPTSAWHSLAWSPDGLHLAAGDHNGRIHLLDAQTLRARGSWLAHGQFVRSLSWNADGKRLASGGNDQLAKIWELTTLLAELSPAANATNTTNATNAAQAGNTTNAVRERQIEPPPHHLLQFPPQLGGVSTSFDVAYNPRDERVAIVGDDTRVGIWNLRNGGIWLTPFPQHRGLVLAASWSPDGKRLATSGYDQTVRVWDGLKELGLFRGHQHAVGAVSWSPDGSLIYSGSIKGVRAWQPERVSGNRMLPVPPGSVSSLAWSAEERWLAVAYGGRVLVADPTSDMMMSCPSRPGAHLLAWHPKQMLLAVATRPAGARLEAGPATNPGATTAPPSSIPNDEAAPAHAPGFRGPQLSFLELWDFAQGIPRLAHRESTAPLTCLAWHPQGTSLLGATSCGADEPGKFLSWNSPGHEGPEIFSGAPNQVASLSWGHDGRRLAAWGRTGEWQVWEFATRTLARTKVLSGISRFAAEGALAWHPREPLLAYPEVDTVSVYSFATNTIVRTLTQHARHVRACSWSPDGTRLAVCDGQGVRLWDWPSGRQVLNLREPQPSQSSLDWGPLGRRLAATSSERGVIWWEAPEAARAVEILVNSGSPPPTQSPPRP